MDFVWSPWRYSYISGSAEQKRGPGGCIFCEAPRLADPAEALVLTRAKRNFALLNLYPYTSGHLMIVPYEHVASLAGLDAETTGEMMELAKRAERALEAVYRPEGFNIGINLG